MSSRIAEMEAATSQRLAEMEKRRQGLAESLDTSLQERLTAKKKTETPASVAESQETRTADADPLEAQNPGAFAKLERLCSEIRHSIVEACFYNLKLQSQLLPKKVGSTDFMQEFRRNLSQLPAVASRLQDFFNQEIDARLKVSSLFKEEYGRVMNGLQRLKGTSSENGEPADESIEAARNISESIDTIVAGLQSIDDRVRKNKVDVKDLLTGVAAASRERCEEAGVKLSVHLPDGSFPRVYSTGSLLSDVLHELIRNSLKHAFPLAAAVEKCIEIVADMSEEPNRSIIIQVADNGQGFPLETLERARTEETPANGNGYGLPMVIHNIENLHGGQVTCDSSPENGTKFVISIPTRPPKE